MPGHLTARIAAMYFAGHSILMLRLVAAASGGGLGEDFREAKSLLNKCGSSVQALARNGRALFSFKGKELSARG
jgi:hypothetical protein